MGNFGRNEKQESFQCVRQIAHRGMQIVSNELLDLSSEAKEWLQFVLAHASHHFWWQCSGPFCHGGKEVPLGFWLFLFLIYPIFYILVSEVEGFIESLFFESCWMKLGNS